jgi:hypothetical protein
MEKFVSTKLPTEKDKKQIAYYHDNVTRLEIEAEKIGDDTKYIRDKIEREIIFLKNYWDRVVDMKIGNYDKIIDLEIFFLKLFIPVFGISFTAGVSIVGIDTYILKRLSLSFIVLFGLFLGITFVFRNKIIQSEEKKYDREYGLVRKELTDYLEDLESRTKKIDKDLKMALENEVNP